MKTLSQFLSEAYDKDVMGSSQIRKTGQRGEIGADRRKSEPERRRMKAAGGGKMVPAKQYKDRKDIGQQRGSQTTRDAATTYSRHQRSVGKLLLNECKSSREKQHN